MNIAWWHRFSAPTGALGGPLADQPGLLQPGQGQVQEPARPPRRPQPAAETAQHAVVEAPIAQIEAARVPKVDAAPHRPGGIAARDRPGTAARAPWPAGQAKS